MDNIVTSMTSGIMVVDNDTNIRVFNKKSENLLMIDAHKVVNKSLNKIKIDKEFIKELIRIYIWPRLS